MIDIDHFKAINDELGHEVGDDVLRAVAKRLRQRARVSDVVARWGGEEFVVILPGTEIGGAGALAEDLRVALAERPLDTPLATVRVTASFGVAQFDRTERPEDVLARADAALYEAKAAGRDAVHLGTRVDTTVPA